MKSEGQIRRALEVAKRKVIQELEDFGRLHGREPQVPWDTSPRFVTMMATVIALEWALGESQGPVGGLSDFWQRELGDLDIDL